MTGSSRTSFFSNRFAILLFLLSVAGGLAPLPALAENFTQERLNMVASQLEGRDIRDPRVLEAMRRVPRHEFVLPRLRANAYEDTALPIIENQTISQPYIVALMTQSAELQSTDRVLEVGTGSGYQAAILGELAGEVYSVEIIEPLAEKAGTVLSQLGYSNVHVKYGDGYQGWKEHAPFDAILITAAAPRLPQPLVDQLKVGGKMVLPIDNDLGHQDLVRFTKTPDGLEREIITGVQFVPMTGEIRK